jgi:hypothetical protein
MAPSPSPSMPLCTVPHAGYSRGGCFIERREISALAISKGIRSTSGFNGSGHWPLPKITSMTTRRTWRQVLQLRTCRIVYWVDAARGCITSTNACCCGTHWARTALDFRLGFCTPFTFRWCRRHRREDRRRLGSMARYANALRLLD